MSIFFNGNEPFTIKSKRNFVPLTDKIIEEAKEEQLKKEEQPEEKQELEPAEQGTSFEDIDFKLVYEQQIVQPKVAPRRQPIILEEEEPPVILVDDGNNDEDDTPEVTENNPFVVGYDDEEDETPSVSEDGDNDDIPTVDNTDEDGETPSVSEYDGGSDDNPDNNNENAVEQPSEVAPLRQPVILEEEPQVLFVDGNNDEDDTPEVTENNPFVVGYGDEDEGTPSISEDDDNDDIPTVDETDENEGTPSVDEGDEDNIPDNSNEDSVGQPSEVAPQHNDVILEEDNNEILSPLDTTEVTETEETTGNNDIADNNIGSTTVRNDNIPDDPSSAMVDCSAMLPEKIRNNIYNLLGKCKIVCTVQELNGWMYDGIPPQVLIYDENYDGDYNPDGSDCIATLDFNYAINNEGSVDITSTVLTTYNNKYNVFKRIYIGDGYADRQYFMYENVLSDLWFDRLSIDDLDKYAVENQTSIDIIKTLFSNSDIKDIKSFKEPLKNILKDLGYTDLYRALDSYTNEREMYDAIRYFVDAALNRNDVLSKAQKEYNWKADGILYNDKTGQGLTGDCWFLSGLMTLSQQDEFQSYLKEITKIDNDNQTYTVTLHGKPYTFTFDEIKNAAELSNGDTDVRAFEMTMRQYYAEKGRGRNIVAGNLQQFIQDMLGEDFQFNPETMDFYTTQTYSQYTKNAFEINSTKLSFEEMAKLIENGDYLIQVSSNTFMPLYGFDENGKRVALVDGHACDIIKIDEKYVYLRNPHAVDGGNHYIKMDILAFQNGACNISAFNFSQFMDLLRESNNNYANNNNNEENNEDLAQNEPNEYGNQNEDNTTHSSQSGSDGSHNNTGTTGTNQGHSGNSGIQEPDDGQRTQENNGTQSSNENQGTQSANETQDADEGQDNDDEGSDDAQGTQSNNDTQGSGEGQGNNDNQNNDDNWSPGNPVYDAIYGTSGNNSEEVVASGEADCSDKLNGFTTTTNYGDGQNGSITGNYTQEEINNIISGLIGDKTQELRAQYGEGYNIYVECDNNGHLRWSVSKSENGQGSGTSGIINSLTAMIEAAENDSSDWLASLDGGGHIPGDGVNIGKLYDIYSKLQNGEYIKDNGSFDYAAYYQDLYNAGAVKEVSIDQKSETDANGNTVYTVVITTENGTTVRTYTVANNQTENPSDENSTDTDSDEEESADESTDSNNESEEETVTTYNFFGTEYYFNGVNPYDFMQDGVIDTVAFGNALIDAGYSAWQYSGLDAQTLFESYLNALNNDKAEEWWNNLGDSNFSVSYFSNYNTTNGGSGTSSCDRDSILYNHDPDIDWKNVGLDMHDLLGRGVGDSPVDENEQAQDEEL